MKIKPPGDRFRSMFPLARAPFGVPMVDPQPNDVIQIHPCSPAETGRAISKTKPSEAPRLRRPSS